MLKNTLKHRSTKAGNSGLTMIEVLVVTAILAVLFVVLMRFIGPQLSKSRDGKRKSDLDKIKVAMENYRSDNNRYPDLDILDNCYGDDLRPYLHSIPCDPLDGSPYVYLPTSDFKAGYKVLSKIEITADPVVSELHCAVGCGGIPSSNAAYEDRFEYRYGVSVGIPVSEFVLLEEGIVCAGSACNTCQISGGGCIGYPMVYPSVQECKDDDNGCDI